MANEKFTEEYETIQKVLKDEVFADDAKKLIADLRMLLRDDGPDKGRARALSQLRDHCERGFFDRLLGSNAGKEAAGILAMAGGDKNLGKKCGALKALRHLHLMTKFGGHCLWILALPKSYRKWATDELAPLTKHSLPPKLNETDEYFSPKQLRDLASSSQTAARWANKAHAICSTSKKLGAEKGDALVRRWFADEDTTDADIATYKRDLAEGFKKIAVTAMSAKLIFTDNPTDRGGEFEESEAYVWGDRLNVVYIEGEFFGNDNLLTGMTNWARIVVHELSHLKHDTVDVPGRYAWGGIQPHRSGFPASKAITNADSWAWFCADCNGALTKKNRIDALKE